MSDDAQSRARRIHNLSDLALLHLGTGISIACLSGPLSGPDVYIVWGREREKIAEGAYADVVEAITSTSKEH
jgi:hypothetical protein